MATYSKTNTILLWTRSIDLEKSIRLIAGTYKPKIKIINANKVQDLMKVPAFLIIIDADFFKDVVIKKTTILAKNMLKNSCSLQIVATAKINIPPELKKLVNVAQLNFDKRSLKKLINFHFSKVNGLKIRIHEFNSRIKRLADIYQIRNTSEIKELSKLSRSHSKSERTIMRDLNILKIALSGSKKPSTFDRTTRIVTLYHTWQTKHLIPMTASCKLYGISERTFRRDIKTLVDSLSITLYYNDYEDAYY